MYDKAVSKNLGFGFADVILLMKHLHISDSQQLTYLRTNFRMWVVVCRNILTMKEVEKN